MNHRRVAAGQGLRWLIDGGRLVLANPLPFLAMGVTLGLIASLPIAAGILLLLFGPALNAGMMAAAREQAAGRGARFEQLWLGFQLPGKLPRLVGLCLPWLAALVLLLAAMLVLGVLITLLGAAPALESWRTEGPSGPWFVLMLLIVLALFLAVWAATVFATPTIMFTDQPLLVALRASLAACLGNAGAVGALLAGMFVASLAVAPLMALLPVRLGELLLVAVFSPWMAASISVAWSDLFGDATGAPPPPTLPPSIEA